MFSASCDCPARACEEPLSVSDTNMGASCAMGGGTATAKHVLAGGNAEQVLSKADGTGQANSTRRREVAACSLEAGRRTLGFSALSAAASGKERERQLPAGDG